MTGSATTRMRLIRNRAVTIAATLAMTAAFAGAASAATTHARPVRPLGILAAAQAKAGQDGSEAGVCTNCAPPLLYHNSAPVMGAGTSSGTITVTPIYWAPTGYNFTTDDPGYQALVNKFITDVAAASGVKNNAFSILTEYYQTQNGNTTNVKYSIAAGTPLADTDAYPSSGQCTAVPSTSDPTNSLVTNYTACITNAQLQAELSSYITANSLPTGFSNLYAVFFPPYVQTQGIPATGYSSNQFCGYHYYFKMGSNTVVYANEPYVVDCATGSAPNNDQTGDGEINVLSHEMAEAITDPLGNGWFDKNGNEVGDECAQNYGPQLGTVNAPMYGVQVPYNAVINNDKYYIQTMFSNAAYTGTGPGTGVGNGCRQTAFGSGGNILPRRLRHDQAGMATQITVDASASSLPADGSSTSSITATVTDANGDPVTGDLVNISSRDDINTPGGCGTLSTGEGVGADQATNAAGQVTVTYTASTVSSDCYVEATDVNAGITDQAVIYQGTETPDAPSITQSTLPAQLVSGGASADFTATAANPSGGSDIQDARFGIYITSDDNSATGLTASQLTLSYKDDATQGSYVNVPLSGTTANGGQISGLVSPDTAEALAAGATRNATFELTLAGNAADTATTGNNLQVQIILDQIDPADGSLTNLDATTPGDVPVTQLPGDTITYGGKLVTTSPPSGSTPGTAELEAKTCHFASDNAACRLTGTASYTAAGGTLTGTITTDPAAGVPDQVINFTETFTTTPGGGTGTGTGTVIYFDNGNTTSENLSAAYQTSQDKQFPNIQETQGTLTFTNPTP